MLGQPIAFHHVTWDVNCVIDNMARRALEVQTTITFWDGHVPEDVLKN